ncbi:hypothetical protein LCGC14_2376330, partial [marine sediment metagenome]
ATAVRSAELGYRTVVLSTDPAHSLGDSFDVTIGNELTELAPNLWGQEIDLLNQMDRYWGRVQNYLNLLFAWQGIEGLVAEDIVDIQSNNWVGSGFCIHSNKHVELNNNNTFEAGSVVSMPDKNDVVSPHVEGKSNPGLKEALRDDEYVIRAVAQIERMIDGLTDMSSPYMPDYINNGTVKQINGKKIDSRDFEEGRIHRINCSNKASIQSGTVIRRAVVATDCDVDFAGGVTIEDAIIATTSTSVKSFTGSSGVVVGVDDGCAPGGGGSLISMGGMSFPAKMNLFGAQLLAKKDIKFAAQARTVEGASVISGGSIDGSSNNGFGYCHGAGLEHALTAAYFRLSG